jgi:hypothetical protein
MEPMGWKLLGLTVLVSLCFSQTPASTLRGKLFQAEGKPPAIEVDASKRVALDGEPETMAVLNDHRLAGEDLELRGDFKTPALFVVGSFYTSKSMIVHKDGKKYTISYWCPVCSIRTYTPGKCMCCQQETHLDLEELK